MLGENMRNDSYNGWGFLAKALAKGLALGLICCVFLFAQDNLRVMWFAISRPLSSQPWSIEEITREFSKLHSDGLAGLLAPSRLVPSGLVLLACGAFGLMDGLRLRQIAKLRRAIQAESERVLAVNDRLRTLSLTDPLTGLANRRRFFDELSNEVKRSERYGQPLTCMMLDLDFFKNINDTHGHQFGDFVLQQVAQTLKNECREPDIIARYGGEEFAIILPNTAEEHAETLAERVRARLGEQKFTRAETTATLTVSIGLCSWKQESPVNPEKLIARADSALYEVKASGRNAVLTWERSHHHTRKICRQYLDEQSMDDLRGKLADFSRDLKQTYISAVSSLLSAVKVRDGYTLQHSYDVTYYALAIAGEMGLGETDIGVINNAANLHDLGKIGIDERILLKPTALSERETEAIKEHPRMAADILRPLKFLSSEVSIIIHHHERYDGAGYPHGLKGETIPLGSRIIAVADAFSAMTTERPYRKAISSDEAMEELRRNAGSQFDPAVVKAFIDAVHKGKILLRDHADNVIPLKSAS
jgi:diguanylate cyclase (GGDEF)-like protein/putative nucleotidyltransferase with HDIG domain